MTIVATSLSHLDRYGLTEGIELVVPRHRLQDKREQAIKWH